MPCKSKSKSTRSWKYYYKQWKKFMDREFKIANSLSKKYPYGKNPVSGKPLKSSKDFVNRLRHEEAMKNVYKSQTKKAYKKQTGKSW
jgi:hypothetical protein